jgi:hypothetical protein
MASAASISNQSRKVQRGRSPETQVNLELITKLSEIGHAAALRDIAIHKPQFEHILLSRDYAAVRALVISIEGPPPIMCSGTFAPEQDFEGNILQVLTDLDTPSELLTLTSFFGGEFGHIVFTWLASADSVCVPFFKTLEAISDDELSSALTRLMFEFTENVHINPSWWEGLAPGHREALSFRMTASANPTIGRQNGCLRPDAYPIDPWTVRERRTLP